MRSCLTAYVSAYHMAYMKIYRIVTETSEFRHTVERDLPFLVPPSAVRYWPPETLHFHTCVGRTALAVAHTTQTICVISSYIWQNSPFINLIQGPYFVWQLPPVTSCSPV